MLRWSGHALGLDSERMEKKINDLGVEGGRGRGTLCKG